ncbi:MULTISPECIES: hypothetical protein [Streptomyces]|uniref:hypothetical protein n=1 Tax=Streptomyces TaxID=1883 RepID=UPI002E2DF799|nr:hypothetical protein [Streptomyces sp. NBC_00258]
MPFPDEQEDELLRQWDEPEAGESDRTSRLEIARRIAQEALDAERHVLELSAATAFRDFGHVRPV